MESISISFPIQIPNYIQLIKNLKYVNTNIEFICTDFKISIEIEYISRINRNDEYYSVALFYNGDKKYPILCQLLKFPDDNRICYSNIEQIISHLILIWYIIINRTQRSKCMSQIYKYLTSPPNPFYK